MSSSLKENVPINLGTENIPASSPKNKLVPKPSQSLSSLLSPYRISSTLGRRKLRLRPLPLLSEQRFVNKLDDDDNKTESEVEAEGKESDIESNDDVTPT